MLRQQELEYTVEETEVIRIGRGPENSIVLDDSRVSENHCEITWDPKSGAVIKDLGSTNGTIILRNQKMILVGRRPDGVNRDKANTFISEDFPLISGDKIRLFSECIIDVEYYINSTQKEEQSILAVDKLEEARKEEQARKEEVARKEEQASKEEEARKEEARKEEAARKEEQVRKEEQARKEEEARKEEQARKKEDLSSKNNSGPIFHVPTKTRVVKSDKKAIILDATIKETPPDGYEVDWGSSLISQFKEKYKMERLEASGYTELWKATPLKWNKNAKPIVIKILTLNKDANSETAELLFEREKKIAPQLDHPNIIKTYKAGRSVNEYYIMMEYCKYGNLAEFVLDNRLQRMPEKMAIRIVIQMLKALNYYHNPPFAIEYDDKYRRTLKDGARKLVHRDIKPMNVLVRSFDSNKNPEIVICDFGLAKDTAMGGSSGITSNKNSVRATLEYAPCDQVQNPALVNQGVDIWSTFAVLFWLLTDETPRDMSGCEFDPIRQLPNIKKYFSTNPVRKIRSLRSDVSMELAEMIDDILCRDKDIPEYSNVEELALINKLESML